MFQKLVIPACSLLMALPAIAADQSQATASVAAVAASPTQAQAPKADATRTASDAKAKELSGMSILGNQEAPKALVIVPWKSSQLGDTLGIAKSLDDGRQPVDKEVFMRQLSYYDIRTGSK